MLHQEGGGRSAGAELALDGEISGKAVVDGGFERVGGGAVFGGGELFFDGVELLHERGGGIGAEERVGVGGVADQFGELGAGAIEDCGQEEAVIVRECVVQLAQVGGGRLVGKDVVGERAEGKDVADLVAESAIADGFGGDVNEGSLFQPVLDVHGDGAGVRGGGDAAACLPVEDFELRAVSGPVTRMD